ncbi:MAG: hypothetical protein HRU70_07955 [Phycisphaeraceae bacterium]|nr:MAG: hypothetical protein HRU70_07955 [Phycisphaeraceae bacterium]
MLILCAAALSALATTGSNLETTINLNPAPSASAEASYLISDKRLHDDPKIWWDGFLNGLRGFEGFFDPIGNPIYFESPLNNSGLRLIYLHHTFDDKSQLQGGNLNIIALQLRVALTERLGLIATKDGYSMLSTGALGDAEGWNAIAGGLKYAFYVDKESDLVVTGGVRYMFDTGKDAILQSGVQELSPFVSFAKGWDRFHLMGSLTDRIPLDDDGNNVLQWDLHADWEFAPQDLPGFAPVLELHGLHYLSDGTRTPLAVGGLDYTNLGSQFVEGSAVIWAGLGARWKLTPHISVGATYEYPLTNRKADIFGDRVTADVTFTW